MKNAETKSTPITPLYDWVAVKRITPDRTPAGLHLVETSTDTSLRAEVIAVGDGRLLPNGELRSLRTKVGDTVLLAQWGGTQVEVDGAKILFLKEEQILAIVQS